MHSDWPLVPLRAFRPAPMLRHILSGGQVRPSPEWDRLQTGLHPPAGQAGFRLHVLAGDGAVWTWRKRAVLRPSRSRSVRAREKCGTGPLFSVPKISSPKGRVAFHADDWGSAPVCDCPHCNTKWNQCQSKKPRPADLRRSWAKSVPMEAPSAIDPLRVPLIASEPSGRSTSPVRVSVEPSSVASRRWAFHMSHRA